MKNRWLILPAAVASIAALLWVARPEPPTAPNVPAAGAAKSTEAQRAGYQAPRETKPPARTHTGPTLANRARVAQPARDGRVILPEIAEIARSLHRKEKPAVEDIEGLQMLVGNYLRICGELPFGLNHEITGQLRGDNSKQYAVLPADFTGINANGELIDRWSTPYFFHSLNKTTLEIRSAGPDRLLWSEDDIGETTSP